MPASAGMTQTARGVVDERVDEHLWAGQRAAKLRPNPHFDRQPRADPLLVLWRDQEAGDDQLPDVQARTRRLVLRPHLRADQGLRVPVRQVQTNEISRHHLREVRRRSDALKGSARSHGPYRAGLAGGSYLVSEVVAESDRTVARHDAEGSRANSLLRELRRHRAGAHFAEAASAALRRRLSEGPGRLRRRPVHRVDWRRGAAHDAGGY